jgi:NRPS condensation-like uncharacterized protein
MRGLYKTLINAGGTFEIIVSQAGLEHFLINDVVFINKHFFLISFFTTNTTCYKKQKVNAFITISNPINFRIKDILCN